MLSRFSLSAMLLLLSACSGLPAVPSDGVSVSKVLDKLKDEIRDVPTFRLEGREESKCKTNVTFTPATAQVLLKQTISSVTTANVAVPAGVVPVAPGLAGVFSNIHTQSVTLTIDSFGKTKDSRPIVFGVQPNGNIREIVPPGKIPRWSKTHVSDPSNEPHLKDFVYNFLVGIALADHSTEPCLGFGLGPDAKKPTTKGSLKIQIDFQVARKVDGNIGLVFTFAKFGVDTAQTNDATNSMILEMTPNPGGNLGAHF